MKRLTLLLIFFISALTFAQVDNDSISKNDDNEIKINLFDLIAAGTVNLEYERYLPKNQALQLGVTLFDHYGYWELGNVDKSNAYSVLAAYKFYMGKREHHGVYFYPYAKYMFGSVEYKDRSWLFDRENENLDVDVNNLSLGIGIGYKWLFADKFTLALDWSFGRTFDDDVADAYARIEANTGIVFGLRF